MDFALEETSKAVRKLAADTLRRECGRAGAAGPPGETGFDRAVWKALGDAGLLTLAVPERLGGAGLGPLEIMTVLAEIGRRAVPVPALVSLAFAALPVGRLGTEEQQDRLLKGLESGRVLTAAVNEPSEPMPRTPRTRAVAGDHALVVSGTKTGVHYAGDAVSILTPVSLDDATGVVLIDPRTDGVSLTPAGTSSGIPSWTLTLNEVRVAKSDLLGGQADPGVADDLYRCAIAGICAVGNGALAGALELTASHVRTREQFGRPLATFQAVAQQLADVYIAARTMDLATTSASWRLGEGRDAGEDLSVAALWLTAELPQMLRTCHHLHGGLGLDVTYPLHRYSSLVKDLAVLLGGAEHRLDQHARRLAAPERTGLKG